MATATMKRGEVRIKKVAAVEIPGMRTMYHAGGYSEDSGMPVLTPSPVWAREYGESEQAPGGMELIEIRLERLQ